MSQLRSCWRSAFSAACRWAAHVSELSRAPYHPNPSPTHNAHYPLAPLSLHSSDHRRRESRQWLRTVSTTRLHSPPLHSHTRSSFVPDTSRVLPNRLHVSCLRSFGGLAYIRLDPPTSLCALSCLSFLGVSLAELIVTPSSAACNKLEFNLGSVETLARPGTGSRVDGVCDFSSPL